MQRAARPDEGHADERLHPGGAMRRPLVVTGIGSTATSATTATRPARSS
jgi:hypothetical protein